jgi:hypothetical protein
MKRLFIITVFFAGALLFNVHLITAQSGQNVSKYEYATVKWDGPDRLFYNLPDKFELVHLAKVGVKIPNEAQDEEWCMAYAANKMAMEGWEPVNLDSRRILFRRAK